MLNEFILAAAVIYALGVVYVGLAVIESERMFPTKHTLESVSVMVGFIGFGPVLLIIGAGCDLVEWFINRKEEG